MMPGELYAGDRIYTGIEKIVEDKEASADLKREGIMREIKIMIDFYR